MNNRRPQRQNNSTPRESWRANLSVWAQILLYIGLIAGAGNQILAQDQPRQDTSAAVVRAGIDALLGGYEHSASPEEWRSLGPAATPVLAAIANDEHALPTRRARSIEGLASRGDGGSEAMLENLAYSEQAPLIVRMSAVRGLGQLLPESRRISALLPLLKATHPQLRGVTAEVLSGVPGGCEAIRENAGGETEAWRSRFARDCAESGSSPSRALKPPRHFSPSVALPARPAASDKGEQFVIPLGTVAVFTDRLSSPITVDIPATAVSFEIVGINANPNARVVVYRIVDPTGTVIYEYGSLTNMVKILPSILGGSFSVLLPNSPTVPFSTGQWTFYLVGAQATNADVNVVFKTSLAPVLDVNLFFVGLPNLSAKSAPADPNFQKVLGTVQSIYSQVGVTLGHISYIDIKGPDATLFSDVQDSYLGSLFELSGEDEEEETRAGAVNVFLVHSIVGGSLSGYIILGESAGIPGTPVRGATASGLAVTTADFPNGPEGIGETMAHEMGHWLGLFHTTESNGLAFDPLPDTPECTQVPYDTDNNGVMEPKECVNLDATNLMFWTSDPSIPNTLLTPDQGFVMLRNPVQNSGLAVNYKDVLRVPEDFPTIQLAVDSALVGDTVRVGPGSWCGALIPRPLNLVGEDATIMGCPPAPGGPVGNLYRTGFLITSNAPGTSISGFVFDGAGFSDTNHSPLAYGVRSQAGTNNLLIDSNTFLGGGFGVLLFAGNDCRVTHNVFDGFTVLLSNGFGGAGILANGDGSGRFQGNVIEFNKFTSTVPTGDYSSLSWSSEEDVPLAAIVLNDQDGTRVSHNKSSIPSNSKGDAGVGILATDYFAYFTTINLTITHNDGRGSQYGLIVTKDQSGGTGNSVGLTQRDNLGLNVINGVMSYGSD